MTLLFCNTGWMEHFQGNTAADTIKGGGSYVTENGMGHEVCNFLPHHGKLFGYVQGGGQGINITRLGANKDDDQIDGITVVWTAKRPNGHTVVVGWYRDATVFRVFQKHDGQFSVGANKPGTRGQIGDSKRGTNAVQTGTKRGHAATNKTRFFVGPCS